MDKSRLITLLMFFCLFSLSAGQNKDSLLSSLYSNFESFDYDNVITISGKLLEDQSGISKKEIIEIYRIRATAEFTLFNEDSARKSLGHILILDENYVMDAVKNSPKMIALFEDLKQVYFLEKQNRVMQDSLRTAEIPEEAEKFYSRKEFIELNAAYRNSVIRSLFMPGWGHLYIGKETVKGTVLTASSIAALSGMIYYIIETNKKEKAYLQESNKSMINSKYNSFNKAFKMRNILIAGFSAIWLYTQIDILYISSGDFKFLAVKGPVNDNTDLTLNFSFHF